MMFQTDNRVVTVSSRAYDRVGCLHALYNRIIEPYVVSTVVVVQVVGDNAYIQTTVVLHFCPVSSIVVLW